MTKTNMPTIKVIKLNEGFEFGHGSISGRDGVEVEILKAVDNSIMTSPAILSLIDKDDQGNVIDDDGCGDGRGVKTVFSKNIVHKRSLYRAKVFGGAVTMTLAAQIGAGTAERHSLNAAFEQAVDTLIDGDIDFGAHTDEHAVEPNCGCGAIDKAPEILLAALKYKTPIRGVVSYLGVNDQKLSDVYKNFSRYVKSVLPYQPAYNGSAVMKRIVDEAKIVKQLGGDHRERRIALNMVRGYTVNQELIREVSGGQAQIFAVDVWRLEDISKGLHIGDKEAQQAALLSELIYTLATAAVLTKGDLPVFVIQSADK
jgi:hypothetical protein